MRIRHPLPLLLLTAVALLAGCDFPADPPLKQTPTPPPTPVTIDSARCLLPISLGNRWNYVPVLKGGQVLPLNTAVLTEISYQGKLYYEMKFAYRDNQPPYREEIPFPPLLQADSTNIRFYDRPSGLDSLGNLRAPELQFSLIYPAAVGMSWERGNTTVLVVAKDTSIMDYAGTRSYNTYRYDIKEHGIKQATFYIIPGSAILRMETPKVTFHTTSWRVY